ncbi:hypothetical protein ACQ4WX_22160 [Streptomyces lasalocidi]
MGVVERVKLVAGVRHRDRGERRPDVRVEIRTRVVTEGPEEALQLCFEVLIGQVEGRGDRTLPGSQFSQPVPGRDEPRVEIRGTPRGVMPQSCGEQRYPERQVPAQPYQFAENVPVECVGWPSR